MCVGSLLANGTEHRRQTNKLVLGRLSHYITGHRLPKESRQGSNWTYAAISSWQRSLLKCRRIVKFGLVEKNVPFCLVMPTSTWFASIC